MKNKKIILGISGGIAAYKAPFLIRLFKKAGASVKVVCTKNALEFVTTPVLETLSEDSVYKDIFPKNRQYSTEHISVTDNADIMIVAPATANIIGKFASGIADDALSTTFMAFDGKTFIAPAMNDKMWKSAVVKKNVEYLEALGNKILYPEEGDLACGSKGVGRMMEPQQIFEAVQDYLKKNKSFAGKKVLITAGPTYEKIDPVRFIGNYSSGKMGFALANEFVKRGAEVNLVSGPVSLKADDGVNTVFVESAQQMFKSCKTFFQKSDILIMAAAVADFRPAETASKKIKKTDALNFNINLVPNEDILAYFGKIKKNKIIVGFALETNDEIKNAQKKLKTKNADIIVLNSLNDKGSGFGYDTNQITLIDKLGKIQKFPLMSKNDVATIIADEVETLIK
ncbi:MAG: bifunctional phosphopantothenoylcysteine decarboxylase/phosphopantothenate--cysteine ligase CoaBC [Bacteroidales bacterium]|nr:bifunctional phosphopantothenoylcysteine decarboxylase/phosphopantothenate--cysteine ligase CoaBC [Bacteroidales bacterium]